MILIDTHTHLYAEEFSSDRVETIEKAISVGVNKFLIPNVDVESILPIKSLCNQFPENCFPMMGMHPTHVNENYKESLKLMKEELKLRKFIAIGEIGIDLFWDKTFASEQSLALTEQIQWAIDYNIPVVIHSREAHKQVMEILNKFKNKIQGVFHCFTGTYEEAQEIIDAGFLLGIGGVLTFKNSTLANVIKDINLEHIILETDSPYLSPAPNRGQRNDSSNITLVAQKLAEIKQLDVSEIAEITTKNALKLFKLN